MEHVLTGRKRMNTRMLEVERRKTAFARVGGITLAYETFGRASDPGVVLIMGLSSQMVMWEDDFCTMLASRGFRVIRFDNRDVGLSSRFTHLGIPDIRALVTRSPGLAHVVPYTLGNMAEDTLGLMDALGMERANVVGVSMGGMIGQELAIRFPERVATLTSIMSTTGDPSLPPPRPEALEMLFWPIPRDREGYIEYFKKVWRLLSGPFYPMDEETLHRLGELTFSRGVDPASSARQFAAILAGGSRKEGLAKLGIPTLVIHGDADPLVVLECGLDTARAVEGSRLVVIEGMGHALPRPLWPRILGEIEAHLKGS